MTTATHSAALESLFADFQQREQVGIAKYGVTVDRTDLTHVEWLQHALEEDMDRCLYMKRAIETAIALINERERLRDALKETIQYVEGFIRIYPLSEESKATVFRARKALEGASA